MQAFLNLRIARFGNDLHGLRRHGWGDILRQGRRHTGKQQYGGCCDAQPSHELGDMTFRMLTTLSHISPLTGQFLKLYELLLRKRRNSPTSLTT